MNAELSWDHATEDIPEAGLEVERAATAEERKAIADALDLIACTSLTARYTISPRGEGHFRLTGTLQARVEQSCVVTLEPLTNDIAESFSVDYWPETDMPAPDAAASSTCTTSRISSPSLPAGCKWAASCSSAWPGPSTSSRGSPERPSRRLRRPKVTALRTAESPFAALAKIKAKG